MSNPTPNPSSEEPAGEQPAAAQPAGAVPPTPPPSMTPPPPPPPPASPKKRWSTAKVLTAVLTTLIVVIGVVAAVAAINGASKGDDNDQARPTLPSTTSASDPASEQPAEDAADKVRPKTNDRGNIVKALGEEGSLVTTTGDEETIAVFAIDAIAVDSPCAERPYSTPEVPENGHFIQLSMRVSTGSQAALSSYSSLGSFTLSDWDFKVIGPDGLTENSSNSFAGELCLDDAQKLPSQIGPGQSVIGSIVLDSKYTTGSIVLNLPGVVDGGWEWAF